MRELPVDTLSAGPRYLQVYVALRERLRAGAYPPGQRLPNQLQLAREFGVSFMTLRRAVELLERDGYLVSRHGLGTFATWQPGEGPPVLIVDGQSAARAAPTTAELADPDDPNGRKPGDQVQVMPDDYGKIGVRGEIVALSSQHIAIRRHDPAAGEIVVHFPRAGFLVSPA